MDGECGGQRWVEAAATTDNRRARQKADGCLDSRTQWRFGLVSVCRRAHHRRSCATGRRRTLGLARSTSLFHSPAGGAVATKRRATRPLAPPLPQSTRRCCVPSPRLSQALRPPHRPPQEAHLRSPWSLALIRGLQRPCKADIGPGPAPQTSLNTTAQARRRSFGFLVPVLPLHLRPHTSPLANFFVRLPQHRSSARALAAPSSHRQQFPRNYASPAAA
ncbi:hypothetical protein BS50DRAFT_125412 [Corynespora cassiicola Philippines]|uniref:Uncharacterized protein n=1 Tax=Corynespora cassiicola Philippines TaxID=1448308 RepID=A0A2T2NB02_CORCC|nr:hypothetical protein BS50DRAFT_125412 [Corynespora cassiicola Philippines]